MLHVLRMCIIGLVAGALAKLHPGGIMAKMLSGIAGLSGRGWLLGDAAHMKLNLGCGSRTLVGFDNLDKSTGWLWESGLPYRDASVEGITVSHSLMYAADSAWPSVFAEMWRVLKPGGVVRVTEDSTDDPRSERYGGYPGCASLTSAGKVRQHMEAAGFEVFDVTAKETHFSDLTLIQDWHGGAPKAFFIEGKKVYARTTSDWRSAPVLSKMP